MAEITVGTVDEIPEGSAKIVYAGGKEIAVFNRNGDFFAIGNTCPHSGGPLGEGFLCGTVITCPLHSWEFDVTTGQSTMNPAITVPTYDVEVRGDDVVLML